MNVARRTLDVVDIPLGEARPTLRLTLEREEGEPRTLTLSLVDGDGAPWSERGIEGVRIPADALEAVGSALEALAE